MKTFYSCSFITKLRGIFLILLLMLSINSFAFDINISNIRLQHNVKENGISGLYVYFNFTIGNCPTHEALIRLYIHGQDNRRIYAPNVAFDDSGEGYACVSEYVQLPYTPSTTYTDYKMFVPYAVFAASPSGSYSIGINFYSRNSSSDADMSFQRHFDTASFTYTRPNQVAQNNYVDPAQMLKNVMANPQFNFDFSNINTVPSGAAPVTPSGSGRQICLGCNGTGRIESHRYVPNAADTPDFYCAECGRTRIPGHCHINCPGCHGTGYIGN